LEPHEKPYTKIVHWQNGKFSICHGHQGFVKASKDNILRPWTIEYFAESDRDYSFIVYLSYSMFFFTRLVRLIIEEDLV